MNKSGIAGMFLACAILVPWATSSAAGPPSDQACESRANDTQTKLAECIRRDSLWHHLAAFQRIADENPNGGGHPNRNIGSPGYKASVDYVARLMRKAGYKVTIQAYRWKRFGITGAPVFDVPVDSPRGSADWFVARLSGSGQTTAFVQPLGNAGTQSASGCGASDFARFVRGHAALLERGVCDYDEQVANAQSAGAAAIVIYNEKELPEASGQTARRDGGAFEAMLRVPARIPVIAVVTHRLGEDLAQRYFAGQSPVVHVDVRAWRKSDIDYNLIADSPHGVPNRVVVVDAHLDSIFGAGMLDNASGSTTILETALKLAHTPTRNQLRFIWFGGEEVGLLGSRHYTQNLSRDERRRIVFDIDVDVTATPNFDILIADPAHAHDVKRFPPDVVPDSRVGNRDFADYFRSIAAPSRNAGFGNDGTDSNSFSLIGVPDSGILTQQDCCKHSWEVALWGGYPGDYEGEVPGRGHACVDIPHRWCDNLSNNDPFVLELVSKAVAAVTLELANDRSLKHRH